jgi:hypothetical protein
MIVESFLIFLSTLISLNTPAETPTPQKEVQTEIKDTVVPQNPPAPLARGGWDRN